MLILNFEPEKGIWADEPDTVEKLQKNYFGETRGGKVYLEIEEALYLINFQNAVCRYKDDVLSFDELATFYSRKEPKLFIRYNAYRDWRDRGLVIRRIEKFRKKKSKKSLKRYPAKKLEIKPLPVKIYWYPESMFSVMEDLNTAKYLFERYWIGQLGIYKQERGRLLKLDFLETVFLSKHFGVKIFDTELKKDVSHKEVLKQIISKREYTKQLYDVYEDWRLSGFVVKTGFKFGSHFRIYFPGASPVKTGKWIHSKHVLHVFPKEERMLISGWARVIRVAHSVKKTFILAIPKLKPEDYVDYPAHYLAYRRKKVKSDWVRETPEDGPRYLLAAVSEDEHIGGLELASLLKKAQDMGLELILSITDRETSVTYYLLKKVVLRDSDYEYYEIEWSKP
jgi:tRNA-intron endonuclease